MESSLQLPRQHLQPLIHFSSSRQLLHPPQLSPTFGNLLQLQLIIILFLLWQLFSLLLMLLELQLTQSFFRKYHLIEWQVCVMLINLFLIFGSFGRHWQHWNSMQQSLRSLKIWNSFYSSFVDYIIRVAIFNLWFKHFILPTDDIL